MPAIVPEQYSVVPHRVQWPATFVVISFPANADAENISDNAENNIGASSTLVRAQKLVLVIIYPQLEIEKVRFAYRCEEMQLRHQLIKN